jgi:lysozyme
MEPSKFILSDLRFYERYVKMPYKDTVGVMTAGIGYNLKSNILNLPAPELLHIYQNGMIETDAENYLCRCVKICIKEIEGKFPWWSKIDGVRQDAIINVVYNIGIPRFLEFKKTIGFLSKQQYDLAATELLNSEWATQVHDRAKRIAQQMRTGKRALSQK